MYEVSLDESFGRTYRIDLNSQFPHTIRDGLQGTGGIGSRTVIATFDRNDSVWVITLID
jgi:hypothetical protein